MTLPSMRALLRSFTKRETLVYARNLVSSILRFFLHALGRSEDERQQSTASMDPAPFDPLKPAIPVSFPIKKLEDLESRSYFKSFHFPFNKASVPLPSASSPSPDRPRLLVCHDMAGGYIDDKWIQGGTNEGAYAIWHWYLIDVFVYFSHNLVTIPPPCWTNTAHKHGVKVLGTFITEWDEGRAICNTLLSTKESAQMYAERLTELAASLGFDGWLINMEVKLDVGQIPNLKEFVLHLTKTMHSSVPGSLVIWYDSVTVDGFLSWQNQLNDKNKPFFDLCDGIFVNYTWTKDYPKLSAAVAGDRKFDVYMGIDVFGRNTYGGGQWNTNVALDVLKKDKVSAAVFAPGWVYETKQPPDFQTAQNRWWGLVEKSWGVLQFYPKVLPFYSNFDQGHGYHFSVDGRQISNDPWCNISLQGFQPVLDNSGTSATDTIKVLVNFEDASYSGGANITFKGTLKNNASFMTRLFQGELHLNDLPIHITYSVSHCSSLNKTGIPFKGAHSRDPPEFHSMAAVIMVQVTGLVGEFSNPWLISCDESLELGSSVSDLSILPPNPSIWDACRDIVFVGEHLGNVEEGVPNSNIVKSKGSSPLGLSLKFISDGNRETSVLLAYNMDQFANKFDRVIVPLRSAQLDKKATEMATRWIIHDSSIMMRGQTLTEIHVICYKSKPEIKERTEQNLQSEGTELAQYESDYYASLGHINIKTSNIPYFPPSNSWVVKGENISWSSGSQGSKTVSINIVWSLEGGHDMLFSGYNIYVVKLPKESVDTSGDNIGQAEYLGVARVQAFYVSNLVVPTGISSLRFIVQVCGNDGTCQKLDSSPALVLGVDG